MKVYGRKHDLKLWQKILFTVLILVGYRLLSHVPLPYVNHKMLAEMAEMNRSMGMLNLLTGGNLETMSIVALGISPYITASIVIQLLGVVFTRINEIQREGHAGQEKIKRITMLLGIILGGLQSVVMMWSYGWRGLLQEMTWYSILIPAAIMTLGVVILSFAGELITKKLFGNGISLILVTGILCSYPQDMYMLIAALINGRTAAGAVVNVVGCAIIMIVLLAFTVWLLVCEKHIHVTYSSKVKTASADDSMIPLKLVGGGVIPIIFASSILTIPLLIQNLCRAHWKVFDIFDMTMWLNPDEWWASAGMLLYFLMIVGFGHYYQQMTINESELALNLKKRGGVVDGIRPGKPTEEYLHRQMYYLTVMGSLGLCIVAFIPIAMTAVLGLNHLSLFGTSLVIVVSVILEIDQKLRAEKLNKVYRANGVRFGFGKSSR